LLPDTPTLNSGKTASGTLKEPLESNITLEPVKFKVVPVIEPTNAPLPPKLLLICIELPLLTVMVFGFELLKLLYEYFSVYIVHNKLNKLIIVKNNIYSHYIKIIQYHIRFLFPNFILGGELPNERIDSVVSFEDRFILKCRIIVSCLLKDLEPTKYYIATGYMSSFLNLGLYVKDLDKINVFLDDPNSFYVLNFESQIKKEFQECISRIAEES
jgi:hypothetical protein